MIFLFVKNFISMDLRFISILYLGGIRAQIKEFIIVLSLFFYLIFATVLSAPLSETPLNQIIISIAWWFVLFTFSIDQRGVFKALSSYRVLILGISLFSLAFEVFVLEKVLFSRTNERVVGLLGSINYSAYFYSIMCILTLREGARYVAFTFGVLCLGQVSIGGSVGLALATGFLFFGRMRRYLRVLCLMLIVCWPVFYLVEPGNPRSVLAYNFIDGWAKHINHISLLGAGIFGSEFFYLTDVGERSGDVHNLALELLATFGILAPFLFLKLLSTLNYLLKVGRFEYVCLVPMIILESCLTFPLVTFLLFSRTKRFDCCER